jgi:arylsulfatase A-like enzyme
VTQAFLDWATSRKGEKPYFAMVHYFDPHWPYDPPTNVMERFGAKKVSAPGNKPSFLVAQENLRSSGGEPGEYEKNLHNLYCAEIRFMDNNIRRILRHLEASGQDKETLVVFTSDHGETFWEHDDYFNHGLFVYDTTLHVPLIMRCPALWPGKMVCDRTLSTLGLGPTLCELVGIAPPSDFQGNSFAGLLNPEGEGNYEERPLFSEATMPYEAELNAPRPNLKKAKAIRQWPWKYIQFPFIEGRTELYNMEKDLSETHNLIHKKQYEQVANELKKRLDQWSNRFGTPRREIKPLNGEALKKLKELGY